MARWTTVPEWYARMGRVGFGGAPIGNLFTAVTDEQAEAALEAAWAGGVRYFDTAPHYGLGLSERRIGSALRAWPRREVVISTKVGRLLMPRCPPSARDDDVFEVPGSLERFWDFSLDGMRRSLEDSLSRLGLDRVDIVLAHDPDLFDPAATEMAVESLVRLRAEGLSAAIGIGTNTSQYVKDYLPELDFVLLAGRHNLLEHKAIEDFLDPALAFGTVVVLGGVLASGILATEPELSSRYDQSASREVLSRVRAIASICLDYKCSLLQAALAFPFQHPAVHGILLGMRSRSEVRENLLALEDSPPPGLWSALVQSGLVDGRAIRVLPRLPDK